VPAKLPTGASRESWTAAPISTRTSATETPPLRSRSTAACASCSVVDARHRVAMAIPSSFVEDSAGRRRPHSSRRAAMRFTGRRDLGRGVGEHLLVLLEPGVHRRPVETDEVAQLLDRRVLVAQRGPGRLRAAASDGERARVATAGRTDAAAVRPQRSANVGKREVVRRVVRHLPDEERPDGVGDDLAAEECAHALGAVLQPDTATGRLRVGRRRAHLVAFRSCSGHAGGLCGRLMPRCITGLPEPGIRLRSRPPQPAPLVPHLQRADARWAGGRLSSGFHSAAVAWRDGRSDDGSGRRRETRRSGW
jgi:hypothetical protein